MILIVMVRMPTVWSRAPVPHGLRRPPDGAPPAVLGR